jgi:hypothetical protein
LPNSIREKAGLAPAFLLRALFALRGRRCCLLPPITQQTVDGSHGTLEMSARSSYVPSSPIGVRSPALPEDARLNVARSTRLELPIWMK